MKKELFSFSLFSSAFRVLLVDKAKDRKMRDRSPLDNGELRRKKYLLFSSSLE